MRVSGSVELVEDMALKKEIVAKRDFLKPWVEQQGWDLLVVYRLRKGRLPRGPCRPTSIPRPTWICDAFDGAHCLLQPPGPICGTKHTWIAPLHAPSRSAEAGMEAAERPRFCARSRWARFWEERSGGIPLRSGSAPDFGSLLHRCCLPRPIVRGADVVAGLQIDPGAVHQRLDQEFPVFRPADLAMPERGGALGV